MAFDWTIVVSVLTISLAILSSWGAVLLGIGAQEWLRNQREKKRTRGLVIAYLNSVYHQLTSAKTLFREASEQDWGEIEVERLYPWIVNAVEPITTGFEDEIARHAIHLGIESGLEILSIQSFVGSVNLGIRELKGLLSIELTSDDRRKLILLHLEHARDQFKAFLDFTDALEDEIRQLRLSIMRGHEYRVDTDALTRKFREVANKSPGAKPKSSVGS